MGRIEAAHFNYDEPLRVRWLCCSCHRRWDKRHPKHGTIPALVVTNHDPGQRRTETTLPMAPEVEEGAT
ncbi:MAG: hypothetical protein IT442_14715 [Phycisphaeraceae bacterium]|nr:hypothetical protein [Phycisphaeraceae bacterium]